MVSGFEWVERMGEGIVRDLGMVMYTALFKMDNQQGILLNVIL